MNGTVVLTEYQDEQVELSGDDATFIAAQLGGRVTIRRAFTGTAYILNPHQFVGLVTLPSGRHLECHLKVPARNLFFMLTVAFDLPDPFLDAPASVCSIDEVLAVVAVRFTAVVEERLDRGLYRAYVEEESNLPTVRGRILIAEDVRHNHVLRHRTYCRYTEYSWDVADNRVLRQVVRLLTGLTFPVALRHRLRALDAVMEEITPGRYVAADLDCFVYNRLNEDYRPLHSLCRFFLGSTSPSDQSGPFSFQAFLIDMNQLFEGFVTRVLMKQTPAPLSLHPQAPTMLDVAGHVRMRPDILIHHGSQPLLVADCKYKRLAVDDHRHHDLYQLLSYCTSLGVSRGVLVYPQHLALNSGEIRIRNSEVSITEVAIDLSGTGEALRLECAALADLIIAMAQGECPETASLA